MKKIIQWLLQSSLRASSTVALIAGLLLASMATRLARATGSGLSMWFSPETMARVQNGGVSGAELERKRAAERQIDQSGRADCEFCGDEIVKNLQTQSGGWTWESESLLGFCHEAKTRKHSPKVIWATNQEMAMEH